MEKARRIISTPFLYRFSRRTTYKQSIVSKMFFHSWLTVRSRPHSNHMNNFNIFQSLCLINQFIC